MVLLGVLMLTEQSVVGAESRDSVVPFQNIGFPTVRIIILQTGFSDCFATAPFKVRFHPSIHVRISLEKFNFKS